MNRFGLVRTAEQEAARAGVPKIVRTEYSRPRAAVVRDKIWVAPEHQKWLARIGSAA